MPLLQGKLPAPYQSLISLAWEVYRRNAGYGVSKRTHHAPEVVKGTIHVHFVLDASCTFYALLDELKLLTLV